MLVMHPNFKDRWFAVVGLVHVLDRLKITSKPNIPSKFSVLANREDM